MKKEVFELIILGSGPAGITAAVYTKRYNLKSMMIGELFGGTVMYPHKINNFPSYSEISGIDLIKNFKNHLDSLEYDYIDGQIVKIAKKENLFEIFLREGESFLTKKILLSMGTFRKKLEVLGEDKFLGKGVHYCAICDAVFYKGREVVVVGGGDGAAMAAMLLAATSKKVYQIIRAEELTAAPNNVKELEKLSNYQLIKNNGIEKIEGNNMVEKIILKNEWNNEKEIKIDGIFIEIGGAPNTALINDLNVKVDKRGYIEVDKFMKTSVENVWAAGDITNFDEDFKQIINACSQGALAAHNIYKSIKKALKL